MTGIIENYGEKKGGWFSLTDWLVIMILLKENREKNI